MNPTDEVDDLLTRAGSRWRADQPSPPEPDLDHILNGGNRPRRWIPALAAASIAAIAATALAVLPQDSPKSGPGDASTSVAQGNQTPANDDLLVRPGDKVQISGQVIAAPGKVPVVCSVTGGPAIGYLPGREPAPTCPSEFAITLKGVDLDRLSDPRTTKGVRSGTAKLIGIWGDRSIDVQEQRPPEPASGYPWPPLPCTAPAGGWVSKPSNINSKAVTAFLDAHAAQIFGPVIHYPKGHSRGAPVVVMVGVAHGDRAALQRAFEKVYSGNLCVAPVLLSRADNERIADAVGKLMTSQKDLGILASAGSEPDGGRAEVSVVAYTEQVKAALSPIGLDLLKIIPAVTPVR